MHEHIILLAKYNEWMNTKVYTAAGQLSVDELNSNRGAFFGSIIGTLNHIMVGDRLWLARFATHPAKPSALQPLLALPPLTALNQILFTDFGELTAQRKWLDSMITQWAGSLSDADINQTLHYRNLKNATFKKHFGSLLLHFFNHQTHHRGQATTLLSQAGKDVGATDLVMLIPDPTA